MAEGANQLAALLINGVAITPTESVNVGQRNRENAGDHQQQPPVPGKGEGLVADRFLQIRTRPRFRHRAGAGPTGEHRWRSPPCVHVRHRQRHHQPVDRNGAAFGATQVTHITSALQISDKSGFVIIGFAVLLGAVGLWRQFNRKKDPDE